MSPDELDDLLQEALDGSATAEQRARLEAAMASPEFAARRAELELVFARLAAVPAAEAPSGLREGVLRRLSEAATPDLRPGARRTLAFRGTLRAALPFALGFAAGAIAFVGWSEGPWRRTGEQSAATMSPGTSQSAALAWRAGRSEITVRGERRGERQTLRLLARSTSGSEAVELRYDPARTSLAALRQADARPTGLEALPGRVRFEPGRHGEYVIELVQSGGGAPVQVVVQTEAGESVRTLPADFGAPEDR